MKSYTQEELEKILISVFFFASANNNQGISTIKGNTYGEKAKTIIASNNNEENKSIVSIISNFK